MVFVSKKPIQNTCGIGSILVGAERGIRTPFFELILLKNNYSVATSASVATQCGIWMPDSTRSDVCSTFTTYWAV